MRGLHVALTLAAALLLAAGTACVGGDDASNSAADEGLVSCGALDELDSYRYQVTVATNTTEAQSPEASATGTEAPLAALGDALADLFSNFQIEGSYVKPDRSSAVLRFEDDELELRVIGDQAWIRSGETWEEDEADSEDDLATPLVLCNDLLKDLSLSLRAAESGPEEVNGVTALRYELDPAKTQDLPSLLGQEIPGGYTAELWLAEDGSWPVRLLIMSSNGAEGPDFSLAMDVRDVNDEGIAIEAPE